MKENNSCATEVPQLKGFRSSSTLRLWNKNGSLRNRETYNSETADLVS